MNHEIQARTELLIGASAVERLSVCRVAVFGVGGVGGFCAEALARCGVGALDLVDADDVSVSNMNRQLIATRSTVGQRKVLAMRDRLADAAPDCRVTCHELFYLPENADQIDLSVYAYVVDCIDTVSAKLELIRRAKAVNVPIICAMGTGNRLSSKGFTVIDLEKTTGCPLARTMRALCRREGLRHVRVLYSPAPALRVTLPEEHGRHAPGSISYVPAIAGLMLAEEVVRYLLQE